MPAEPLDDLRSRLRELGYLSRGVERWFALDPLGSRRFWQELMVVAGKAALLVAPFAALPMIVAMVVRNRPLPAGTGVALASAYLILAFAAIALLVTATALVLKTRPASPIDHPILLTGLALGLSVILSLAVAGWWSGFVDLPSPVETAAVLASILLLVAAGTVVFSAAILSFSVREARQIPAVARSSRSGPILVTGCVMILLALGATRIGTPEPPKERPRQIVVAQTNARVALLAVDGLTFELFRARSDLASAFETATPVQFAPATSAAELWSSAGTGTPSALHQVRSVEGVRLAATDRNLQQISRFDPLATRAAASLGIVKRQPLPASIRERDYVWEILASRGVPAAAVNWWVSADEGEGPLRTVAQEAIFAPVARLDPAAAAVAIDARALGSLDRLSAAPRTRFATAYLPALDILTNRLDLGTEARLARSLKVLDALGPAIDALRRRGYEIVLAGSPSHGARGEGVIAATFPLAPGPAAADDLAPTLLDRFGFPASNEMTGRSLLPGSTQGRIGTFGSRSASADGPARDQSEYHDALRSLGYVR